jgi:radical SAM superfamily enzyme YgiQ (UPF0313 family)
MSLIQIKPKDSLENKVEIVKNVIDLKIQKSDIKIWLVDPTYTQQQISSESMPSAIGGIATFTEENLDLNHEIRLFKYPEKLAEALEKDGIPDIIGFSNYMWNFELSLALAKRVKEYANDTIIVMGGPNYPVVLTEQEEFLRKYSEIDFYIIGEGELAFANLAAALIRAKLDKNDLPDELPSVHYIKPNNEVYISSYVERIKDLTEIPSPYLKGKLDKFFDGKLQPVIQTTRGCPFGCTFCVEGTQYYSKIYRNNLEKIESELEYIGSRMKDVKEKGGRNDLWLVDSNFGMYSQDIDTCKAIARSQEKFGWPEYIQCDTGKNNKARVLSAAKLVKGAMRISGSVQTLDADVLKNIKRSNISSDELMKLAVEAAEIEADSRSEIILGLPGESLKSHFNTIDRVINAGFNHVNTYQLMMLPGTEVYSKEIRQKFEIKTRFRVLPRCFGYYDVLGKRIKAAEIEEVCISSNTLPFEDYIKCRKMHLVIHIFNNDGFFESALKFLKYQNLSIFSWLDFIFKEKLDGETQKLFEMYEKDTRNELWLNREDGLRYIQEPGVIDSYIDGELGYNLLFVHKTIALEKFVSSLKELAIITIQKLLIKNNLANETNLEFIKEAITFDAYRITNLFHDLDSIPSISFHYDIEKFNSSNEKNTIGEFKLDQEKKFNFILDDEQKDIITRSLDLYGRNDIGISRVLSKIFVKKILRKPITDSQLEILKIGK